ncbi:MAG: glucosaminidase domain-containing protein [Thermoleophilia bacterium]|nr:glucosaminidase domain-containing protein [Thermoleophilia bacterium]
MRYPVIIAAAIALALPAGLAAQGTSQPQAPTPSGGTTTPVTTAPATQGVTPVMGQSRLSGDQIASWFATQKVTPRISIPMAELARMFVDEGNAQNIRGDIAFVQSILETGWFRYEGSMVKPSDNNYSGLGACDSCSRGNIFATPQDGVRAQIQHLWAYADPKADPTRTARPLTDIRFTYVRPYGRAPTWEAMGNGNWATGGGYTEKILRLYASMLRHNGLEPQTTTLRTIASGAPSGPLAVWVTRKGAVRLADVRGARGTLAAARKSLGPGTTRAAYGNCRATWASLGAIMTFSPARGGSTCGDDARLRAAVLTGPQWVTAKGLKPGDSVAKARKLYGKKVARGSMGVLVRSKSGARLTARMGEGVVKALIVAVPRRR